MINQQSYQAYTHDKHPQTPSNISPNNEIRCRTRTPSLQNRLRERKHQDEEEEDGGYRTKSQDKQKNRCILGKLQPHLVTISFSLLEAWPPLLIGRTAVDRK